MKKLIIGLVVGVATLFAVGTAQADPIVLQPGGQIASGTDQANSAIVTYIQNHYGPLDELYKATQSDGSEEGDFASSYTTTFAVSGQALANALIKHDIGDASINSDPVYALMKDGTINTADPTTWYFFDISGWNGTDDILFRDFFNGNQGKISHVSIWGDSTSSVPEGGLTALLLGMGLSGLGLISRRIRK